MPITLLTIEEKMAELRVSRETLRRWRRDGQGPKFVQYGGVVRYYPSCHPVINGGGND